MCTMKIWKRNDTHFFITGTFLLQNSATRSILSQGKKKKKVFWFYFSFQSFISQDQPPHSELPSSFLTSTFEKYQGVSIPSFTHGVVYGNQPRCFLELGYDSLF